jgi:hypothetical protein
MPEAPSGDVIVTVTNCCSHSFWTIVLRTSERALMSPDQNASCRYAHIFERFPISPDQIHGLISRNHLLEAACDDYLLALSKLKELQHDRRDDDPIIVDYTKLVQELECEIAGMLGCSPQ